MKSVRIGGGLGFYGDSYVPALELIAAGDVQYVGFDHLAELTLAILQKDRERDARLGYARDLVPLMREALPLAKSRGVRLISNAGGLNPRAAARAVAEASSALGLDVAIGVVLGDDVSDRQAEVVWEDGGASPDAPRAAFAHAYLGALGVKRALEAQADVVLTGRVADSALFLGAIAHGLHWRLPGEEGPGPVDWNLLAAGAMAGHLLECSGQVAGGNHSGDWRSVPGLERIGYPIAVVDGEGSLEITKAPGTGGRVDFQSVREQLLYEVHDPSSYHTPDVTVDLTGTNLREIGADRVEVAGLGGRRPLGTYKVVAGMSEGYLGQGMIGFSWPNALEKARAAAEILRRQIASRGLAVLETKTEYLGFDSFHGPLAEQKGGEEQNEVYLRMAVRTKERRTAEAFSRLFPPLALSGPPTASGFIDVDRVRQLVKARVGALARAAVDPGVKVSVRPASAFAGDGA